MLSNINDHGGGRAGTHQAHTQRTCNAYHGRGGACLRCLVSEASRGPCGQTEHSSSRSRECDQGFDLCSLAQIMSRFTSTRCCEILAIRAEAAPAHIRRIPSAHVIQTMPKRCLPSFSLSCFRSVAWTMRTDRTQQQQKQGMRSGLDW